MTHIGLITGRSTDDIAWADAIAAILREVADVRLLPAPVSTTELTGLGVSSPLVVTTCDAAVVRDLPCDHDVVIAPSPTEIDVLDSLAEFSHARIRVLALTTACHTAAQRAGLCSAYFQFFPDPSAKETRGGQDAPFSFLQRMARGHVVALYGPLAADYIVDTVNGFSAAVGRDGSPDTLQQMSASGRLAIAQGLRRWRADQERLRAWIVGPPSSTIAMRFAHEIPMPARPRVRTDDTPLVTVATVVRNAADDLQRTLPSVCGQRFGSLEIIVVDGGSTDGTLDVIRDCANHIDHWESAPDEGPYDAMQKAAVIARGRWILFMNAGDRFVDEDALGRLVEAARADADFVAGHHVYVSADGIEMVNHCVDFETTYARLLAGNLDSSWIRGTPGHQAVLTATELLRRHRFDLSFRIAADHEFMYRMRSLGAAFQVVPTIVSEYVGGGLSARQEFRCLEEWRRIAHAHASDVRRADRSLDRMLAIAMKHARRRGPFDFTTEPARSRPFLAARIDLAHRVKSAFRRSSPS